MFTRTFKLIAAGAAVAIALFAVQAVPAGTAHAESCDTSSAAECGRRPSATTPVAPTPPGVQAIVIDDPVSAGALRITTDKNAYFVGESILICFQVPAPGPIRITDHPSNGRVTTLWSWYDDGTGACRYATVTPPAGQECLRLTWFVGSRSFSDRTCFFVYF